MHVGCAALNQRVNSFAVLTNESLIIMHSHQYVEVKRTKLQHSWRETSVRRQLTNGVDLDRWSYSSCCHDDGKQQQVIGWRRPREQVRVAAHSANQAHCVQVRQQRRTMPAAVAAVTYLYANGFVARNSVELEHLPSDDWQWNGDNTPATLLTAR